MKRSIITLFTALNVIACYAQQNIKEVQSSFLNGYKTLHMQELQLNFKKNILSDTSIIQINQQRSFFSKVEKLLKGINEHNLNEYDLLDYKLMKYETDLGLEFCNLEFEFIKNPVDLSKIQNIYQLPNGNKWYYYFLKRWTGANVSPAQIFDLGLREVQKAQLAIKEIIIKSGKSEDSFYAYMNDPRFFESDEKKILDQFENAQKTVDKNLYKLFVPYSIPELKIKKGSNAELSQTPGYYNAGVFYFNLFSKPYDLKQVGWLYIHEGIPGHHFQTSISHASNKSPIHQLFWYPGYAEGWGAYVESFGAQLGLYKNIYDELGRWQWDIVRSVRLCLDAGLNYYGWTNTKALEFWKENIKGQDDIAQREIDRVQRWPCQDINYKYGASQFEEWQTEMSIKNNKTFDIRKFHNDLLKRGDIPLSVLKSYIVNNTSHPQ